MAIVVGLTGKAGSGKDAAVEQFLSAHEHPLVQRLAFATGVKHSCAAVFQEPLGKFYENKEDYCEQWGMSYRDMLQKLGTDFAREMIDADFWVKWLSKKFDELPGTIGIVFITDVRFDNEAQWIQDRGGVVIEISRQGSESLLNGEAQQHASEAGISRGFVDVTIVNRGTLVRLGEQLNQVLKDYSVLLK